MKKIFLTLALAWALMPLARSATLTVSNYNGLAAHGIASSTSTLVAEGKGLIGRMTITDQEIETLLASGNITALVAAFEVFGSTTPFPVTSFDQNGLFETQVTASTVPSQDNEFAGSPIFIWLFVGANRLAASEILLAKLPAVFPEDSAVDPPAVASVFLRPDATFFAGSVSAENHDYGLGGGAVAKLEMEVQFYVPLNQPPVATPGILAVTRGQSANGTVTGTDEDEDTLTFFLVDEPAKGTVIIQENGSYQYTSTLGLTGDDSFTFRAFDGVAYSEPATVSITISDLPPGSVAPVIAITQLDSGYVGSFYEFQVPIANAPQGDATTFSANGLPGGLKMDKNTGVISGYPTKAFTDKTVTLLAKNSAGDSGQVPVTITIKDVPAEVVGTFLATVERDDGIADGFGGRLNLTVTSKGAFTAKLQSGPTAYTAKGKLTIAEDDEDDVTVEVIGLEFSRKNFPTLTANLFFDLSDLAESDFQLTGRLSITEEDSADITGVRNTWTKTSKPTQYTGGYTFSLRIPDDFLSDDLHPPYPQGDGFGALTVKDNGTATFVGRTADGKAFTVPTILGPQGHLPLFSPFAVKTSSLVATPRIVIPDAPSAEILNSLTGDVSWMKPPADTKSKDRAYRAGFDAFDLALLGGMYKAPAPGGVVAGLEDNGPTDTEANAWLTFASGGLVEGDISTFPFTIMNKNKNNTGIKQTVIVPKATPKTPETDPNPNTVTFKLLPKPAGYFSGTFTLPNEVKSLTRKTPFQGTFVRLSDGSYERAGFFLLAELPEGSEKITQTPQHSGLIELLASDPDAP